MKALLGTALVFGLWSLPAGAQSVTQTIEGVVRDATGAVAPAVAVTITHRETEISHHLDTNEKGSYRFSYVPVGLYDIRCELRGFRTRTLRGVRVETNAQVRQNFELELGEVSETIEVSASAVLLNTENANVSSVVDNRRVTELPLNGRNVSQLAVLAPGVQFGLRSGLANSQVGNPIPGSSVALIGSGIRAYHQVVSIDGIDAKEPRTHATPFIPSIDAIEEFKVQTNSYDAQVGFGGGAIVTITMKSGTNAFHGSVFEFLRNDTLNAENYFLNFELPPGAGLQIEDTRRRNQFGTFLRGPLVKNRTFWAFSWESQRDIQTQVGRESYPLDSFREGNFSELLTGTINPETGTLFRQPIVLYDPFTGDPFPNNMVPQSRQHPGIVNNIFPEFVPRARFRQADPLDFTEIRGVPQGVNKDQYFVRIDHHFSDADRIFARLLLDQSDIDSPQTNPSFGAFTDSDTTNLATQWVHTLDQQSINELRVGFQTADQVRTHPRTNDENFDLDSLGIGPIRAVADNNRVLTPREHGLPRLRPFLPSDTALFDFPDTFQVGDHVSMMRGNHNLRMGYELYHVSMERTFGNAENGWISFSSAETGLDQASFLMGLPNFTLTPMGHRAQFPRSTRQGAYIHDDWKISAKLTLNLGLRFDYNGNLREITGEWRTINFPGGGRGLDDFVVPATGELIPTFGPEFVDERGAVKLWKQDVKFFMPRVGIAYRPAEKWVLRVGAGWFDNLMHQNTFTLLNLNPPKSVNFRFNSVTDNAQTIPVTGADGASYNVRTRAYREGNPVITLNDPFFVNAPGDAVQGAISSLHIPPDYKDGDVWKSECCTAGAGSRDARPHAEVSACGTTI